MVVGEEYLVSHSNDWLIRARGHLRVRLLDNSHHWQVHSGYHTSTGDHAEDTDSGRLILPGHLRRVTQGGEVLVVMLDEKTGKPGRLNVVRPASVRGVWAEAWARHERERRIRQQRREESERQRRETRARIEAVHTALGTTSQRGYDSIVMSVEDGERIVATIKSLRGES